MTSTSGTILVEILIDIGVVLVVWGSIVLFSWIGSKFRDRPSRGLPTWLFDRSFWEPPPPPSEPSMFGKIMHGERVTDERVTAQPPVDLMLSDPIDEEPKDLRG